MNGKEFLQTAYEIAQELFPDKVSHTPIELSDQELESIICELEARTGYIRKAEFQASKA